MAVTLGPGTMPAWHSNAVVRNVVLFVVAKPAPDLSITVQAGGSAPVAVVLIDGMALSNAPPLTTDPPQPPAPLNTLLGLALPQTFTIRVSSAQNAGIDLATKLTWPRDERRAQALGIGHSFAFRPSQTDRVRSGVGLCISTSVCTRRP